MVRRDECRERWSALIEQLDLEIFPVLLEGLPGGVEVAASQAFDKSLMLQRHFLGGAIEGLPLDEKKLDLPFEVRIARR